eukprot:CAMPEP_0201564174 /NCGR_PEP_ID=MMETSP0190_2-20130828/2209_1 /ASSEMBLY_ACC=CAM_ASM_000263 /TAXON_ID=37353 /ORGANISM="Rosalina sp." /LENGTH=67 /DNA_ID=CAMNT_0047979983 /DNA_START=67 /DNA_END=270 /DNA_ORIENTATION=+
MAQPLKEENNDDTKEEVVGLDEEEEEDTVVLIANDGSRFEISKKAAMMSNLVKTILEVDKATDNDNE